MTMKKTTMAVIGVLAVLLLAGAVSVGADGPNAPSAQGEMCTDCHREVTPHIVEDWSQSKHGERMFGCFLCHGSEHISADDVDKAQMPTIETCRGCHAAKVEQFLAGKHALAWEAMLAIPMAHLQPKEIIQGQKGCGGCHKIGIKTEAGMEGYRYGVAGCDACHTRHKFSAAEARRPEACATCHMGFDHPQWEMWSESKHGTIYHVEGDTWDWNAKLSEGATYRAPTCQFCHMPGGDHEVLTSWGFLGLRVEEPDPEWAEARATILKAVGALGPEGNPAPLFEGIKALRLARLTMDEWQRPRDEMLNTCTQCHSEPYARQNLEMGDAILKQADLKFAQAINTIKGLYKDKLLPHQDYPSFPYPDLLQLYEAPTSIEQDLYRIWFEYRQRAFQGAFHMNFDYQHWYGWAPLKETALRIEERAGEIRQRVALEEKAATLEEKAAALRARAGLLYPLAIGSGVVAIVALIVAMVIRRK